MNRMNDLISRQAAVAHAISGLTRELEGEKWIRVSEVRESLQTMPSAERRGSWVGIDDEPCDVWECDRCGHIVERECPPRFCEECGARMEVE